RPGPARDERDVVAVAHPDHFDHLPRRGREDDHVRHALLDDEAVALVDEQLAAVVEHVLRPDRGGQVVEDPGGGRGAGGDGHRRESLSGGSAGRVQLAGAGVAGGALTALTYSRTRWRRFRICFR